MSGQSTLKLTYICGNALKPEYILLIMLDLILERCFVVIDAHFKWIDVKIVNIISAESIIAVLHTIFATTPHLMV